MRLSANRPPATSGACVPVDVRLLLGTGVVWYQRRWRLQFEHRVPALVCDLDADRVTLNMQPLNLTYKCAQIHFDLQNGPLGRGWLLAYCVVRLQAYCVLGNPNILTDERYPRWG
jgi:hypothetical protein